MHKPEFNKSDDVLNRVMIKDNVAIITLLEEKESGNIVLVANAHLHWDPQYADVKVIQTALLMDEVGSCISKWKKMYNFTNLSTLICGDFNSLPESGPIELLAKGNIPGNHEELKTYNYGDVTKNGIQHSLKLKSAYSNEVEFTNFTPLFKGTIDYIWYDTSNLITTGILGGVDGNYVSKTVGFPNPHHPSDHIPLVVGMRIKNSTKKENSK